MTYSPRPQPRPVGRGQRDRNRAWWAWEGQRRRLADHVTDLVAAGRLEEALDYQQTVVAPHWEAQPKM